MRGVINFLKTIMKRFFHIIIVIIGIIIAKVITKNIKYPRAAPNPHIIQIANFCKLATINMKSEI